MTKPWPGWTPELDAAWAVIAWWHRVRPEHETDYFVVPGPIGWALIRLTRRSTFVPECVKDARTLLGFNRTNRTEGERP